ncbi:hypothetical protein A2U01_0045622, partial [Trifolium medium]|nr:hypothetical protein [Trifolium medium]
TILRLVGGKEKGRGFTDNQPAANVQRRHGREVGRLTVIANSRRRSIFAVLAE